MFLSGVLTKGGMHPLFIRETWWGSYRIAEVSRDGERAESELETAVQKRPLENHISGFDKKQLKNARVLHDGLDFTSCWGQPLQIMPKLELGPTLPEQPLYH